MRKPLVSLIALGMLLSGCSGSEAEETTTTSSTTSSTTTTTEATSTTAPSAPLDERPTSPLNGLPVDDPETLERRVLGVKIDNHPNARPQSGLNDAEIVIEILVEGVTRFLTLWQQSDSDYLGPMRSGRPTDGALMAALNEPTFSISGAQSWVQSMIRGMGVHLTGEVRPATFRVGWRSAPHNLYANTTWLREYADDRGHPDNPLEDPIWEFGELPAGGTDLESAQFSFFGNSVVWVWDADREAWLRTVGGSESNYRNEDASTGQLSFPVLIALNVEQYTVPNPGGGKGLTSSRTTGSGTAYVLAEGRVIEGTWERETETDWFTITDASGDAIPIPPGKVWISLIPGSAGVTLNPAGNY